MKSDKVVRYLLNIMCSNWMVPKNRREDKKEIRYRKYNRKLDSYIRRDVVVSILPSDRKLILIMIVHENIYWYFKN